MEFSNHIDPNLPHLIAIRSSCCGFRFVSKPMKVFVGFVLSIVLGLLISLIPLYGDCVVPSEGFRSYLGFSGWMPLSILVYVLFAFVGYMFTNFFCEDRDYWFALNHITISLIVGLPALYFVGPIFVLGSYNCSSSLIVSDLVERNFFTYFFPQILTQTLIYLEQANDSMQLPRSIRKIIQFVLAPASWLILFLLICIQFSIFEDDNRFWVYIIVGGSVSVLFSFAYILNNHLTLDETIDRRSEELANMAERQRLANIRANEAVPDDSLTPSPLSYPRSPFLVLFISFLFASDNLYSRLLQSVFYGYFLALFSKNGSPMLVSLLRRFFCCTPVDYDQRLSLAELEFSHYYCIHTWRRPLHYISRDDALKVMLIEWESLWGSEVPTIEGFAMKVQESSMQSRVNAAQKPAGTARSRMPTVPRSGTQQPDSLDVNLRNSAVGQKVINQNAYSGNPTNVGSSKYVPSMNSILNPTQSNSLSYDPSLLRNQIGYYNPVAVTSSLNDQLPATSPSTRDNSNHHIGISVRGATANEVVLDLDSI